MQVDELSAMPMAPTDKIEIEVQGPDELRTCAPKPRLTRSTPLAGDQSTPHDNRWLMALHQGLGHQPYLLQARCGGELAGILPLAFVKSRLFGRFLVSLPYVNSAGVRANSEAVTAKLISSAVSLADKLDVRYLELRQESEVSHPALTEKRNNKVLMRLTLPATPVELMDGFKSKLRSQIRTGQKNDFEIQFGALELLADFYRVFSKNMRDLGTPVYSRGLFASILRVFGGDAELCVLRLKGLPVAAAILVHGPGTTEVPSASSLRAFNSTSANMVMYLHLLSRAIEKGQKQFDFGRSTLDSGTFRFKAQWGAKPHPSVWQYYVRRGSIGEMRPDNAKFGLAIKMWQRLPVWLTRLIGPPIVRGIP
jgi:FemAB-related protein (PEP-CTERM system-associated)